MKPKVLVGEGVALTTLIVTEEDKDFFRRFKINPTKVIDLEKQTVGYVHE